MAAVMLLLVSEALPGVSLGTDTKPNVERSKSFPYLASPTFPMRSEGQK